MNNKLAINKNTAIFNIIAIIVQIVLVAMTHSNKISIIAGGLIILVVALIDIILNIIALAKSSKHNISKSGAIFGILGGIFMIIFSYAGWILLIISTVQLFRQKPANN